MKKKTKSKATGRKNSRHIPRQVKKSRPTPTPKITEKMAMDFLRDKYDLRFKFVPPGVDEDRERFKQVLVGSIVEALTKIKFGEVSCRSLTTGTLQIPGLDPDSISMFEKLISTLIGEVSELRREVTTLIGAIDSLRNVTQGERRGE